ncbi:Bug family tripartite tricarboxylate transporter substrate binding protein [Faunimonas sp. B44]|uniref:Bug family tripartite tricarboxylate transporter substrate binding protein n=1 Tax=Faunimonas sp. B44 TaxID=3461493 RepID=UPI00404421D9
MIANDLGEALGDQPVVVENRPGANGYVAWRSIAQAAPDGYTLLLAENAVAINRALRPDEPLDPAQAFHAIGRIGVAPIALVVNKDIPVKSLQELAAYSKENDISYSSSGVGSVTHMTTEALLDAADIRAVHVPYRGGGEATSAVIGGHVQMMHSALGNFVDLAKEGTVKILSVSTDQRLPALPDVPTLSELGVDTGMDLRFWWGMFAPAGTPEPVKQKLEAAVQKILQDPQVIARLDQIQVTAAPAPGSEFSGVLDAEITNWSEFVKEKGISAE